MQRGPQRILTLPQLDNKYIHFGKQTETLRLKLTTLFFFFFFFSSKNNDLFESVFYIGNYKQKKRGRRKTALLNRPFLKGRLTSFSSPPNGTATRAVHGYAVKF